MASLKHFNRNSGYSDSEQKTSALEEDVCFAEVCANQFEIEEEYQLSRGKNSVFGFKNTNFSEKLVQVKKEEVETSLLTKRYENPCTVQEKSVEVKKNQKQNGIQKLAKKVSSKNLEKSECELIPEEPYYDFSSLDFKFSAEELKNEPCPKTMWMHMTCMYWIPEIYFDNSQNPIEAKNVKGIDREKFRQTCSICQTSIGVCIKCSDESCKVQFHPECARRANIHLEMIIQYQTKFNIHCHEHTPKLLSNLIQSECKKTQEEIVKYYKYLQKLFKCSDIVVPQNGLSETQTFSKCAQKSKPLIIVDESDEEDQSNGIRKQKIEIQHIIKFLPYKQKIALSRSRQQILKHESFQFTISLKRLPDSPNEFNFESFKEPEKKIYKNFIGKRDKIWASVKGSDDVQKTLFYTQFKSIVETLQSIKKNYSEFFSFDKNRGFYLIKSFSHLFTNASDPTMLSSENIDSFLIRNRRDFLLQVLSALERRNLCGLFN